MTTPTQNGSPHFVTEIAMPKPPSMANAICPKFSRPV